MQTKLAVSTPVDPYEQEADQIASTVLRMPDPALTNDPTTPPQVPLIAPPTIARVASADAAPPVSAATDARLQHLSGDQV